MKRHWCGLFLLLCVIGAPMAAFGDAPASDTWAGPPTGSCPGGTVTASTVDFDTWMEKQAEWVYDNDTPYSGFDPNGEPDGVAKANSGGQDWPPTWDRGDPDEPGPPPVIHDPWPDSIVPTDSNGNGIPDVVEFAVIKEICNNTDYSPGSLHTQVHESYKKNFAYLGANLGLAGNMVPKLKYILAAYAMLGDGNYQRFRYPEGDCPTNCTEYGFAFEGSWGVTAEIVFTMNGVFANGWRPAGACATCNSAPNGDLCDRLEDLLSACGDVDGDGVTNIGEFYGQGGEAGVYSATVRAAYVAAVLDPLVTTDGGDPDEVCVEAPPGPGLTWNVNLWYNPTNHYVYTAGLNGPWPLNEAFATGFTLGDEKVPVVGHLATVDSAALKDWIVATIMPDIPETVWIGGNDLGTEGDWVWVATGVQFWEGVGSATTGHGIEGMYSNWNGGPADQSATTEPNESNGEDACEMNTAGGWNDNDHLTTSNPGIIEFSNGGEGFADGDSNGYPDFWETYVPARAGGTGPTADFTGAPTGGMQPLEVTFTDASEPYEGQTITSWSWDFGDENPLSTEQNPTHIYEDFVGSPFTVSLTVIQSDDASATKTETGYITVTERLYRASIDAAGGAWLEEGDLLSLTAVVTGGTPPIEYRWQKNGEDIVPPATDATYEKVAAIADSGEYTCVVNDDSKAETLAGPYIVTVFPEGSLPVAGIVGLALLAGAAILGARSAFRKK